MAEHHLGHRRAADVARAHEADPETHHAIVASRARPAITGTASCAESRAAQSPAYAWPVIGSAQPDWLSRAVLELVPAGPVEGTLDAPSSKSLTNRLLVIAALAEGRACSAGLLESDDTVAMTSGLRALGARIEDVDGDTEVTGTSGRPVAGGRR